MGKEGKQEEKDTIGHSREQHFAENTVKKKEG